MVVQWTLSVVRVLARPAMAAALGLALLANAASAHDIPNQIVLNAFVKPEGQRLHVILRVPLIMLTSMNLPKRGPGYLALDRIDEALQRSLEATAREIELYEDGRRLTHLRAKARISEPSQQAFETYEDARAFIAGPGLPESTDVFWNQGYFDAHYEYPIGSDRSRFALDFRLAPGLSGRLKMILRFMPPDGTVLAYDIHGGFGRVSLDPNWYQAAWTFVKLGFSHILDGLDHLLFLLCLVIPFGLRQFWGLIAVVTSFTVAHSVTLIAAALGMVPAGTWFPPLVEVLIALSILYMALENILATLRRRAAAAILQRRWLVTGLFGLVHGFGFSFALKQDLQFAGSHFLLSLLSFNVGVELGQILVLLIVVPVLSLLFKQAAVRRVGVVVASILVAHTAWHWLIDRAEKLRYVEWPEWTAQTITTAAGLAVLLGLLTWGAWRFMRQVERRRHGAPSSSAE